MSMARIPLNGGFSIMDEGTQVLRIYGVDYNEKFGNLTLYLCNAQAQTMRETFRLIRDGKPNENAMNAFAYFAKTAMNDFDLPDIDPQELVGHYIQCEVVHNPSADGTKTYANLGREKQAASGFDNTPKPEALTMKKPEQKPFAKTKAQEAPQEPQKAAQTASSFDLDDLLGL